MSILHLQGFIVSLCLIKNPHLLCHPRMSQCGCQHDGRSEESGRGDPEWDIGPGMLLVPQVQTLQAPVGLCEAAPEHQRLVIVLEGDSGFLPDLNNRKTNGRTRIRYYVVRRGEWFR